MDSDSKPVLTLIIINAPLSLENTSTIALEVASKLIKSQVIRVLYLRKQGLLCMSDSSVWRMHQVSNVTLLAAVRFSPKTTANASLVHTIGFKSGAVQALSKHEKLCEWDPAWPIEDGFLAAMLQVCSALCLCHLPVPALTSHLMRAAPPAGAKHHHRGSACSRASSSPRSPAQSPRYPTPLSAYAPSPLPAYARSAMSDTCLRAC
eukprot:2867415-Rhodomonas_salina.2